MTTTWQSGGQPYSVVTERMDNETDAHLIRRHFDDVTAALATHPIDP